MRAESALKRALFAVCAWLLAGQALALEIVPLPLDAQTVDLSGGVERYLNQGDSIQVSTAPDADGVVRRIEVPLGQP